MVGEIPKVTPNLTKTQLWKSIIYSDTSHLKIAYTSLHRVLHSSTNISEDMIPVSY